MPILSALFIMCDAVAALAVDPSLTHISLVCAKHNLSKTFSGRKQILLQCKLCIAEASSKWRSQHQ